MARRIPKRIVPDTRLVLARRRGEQILIGTGADAVLIEVKSITFNEVRLAVSAPGKLVNRVELLLGFEGDPEEEEEEGARALEGPRA